MNTVEFDFTGMEVLVVDDDPVFRDFVTAGLRKHGARSQGFVDGESLITALQARSSESDGEPRVSAILLDVMMPGLTGWEVLAALRQDHSDLPVILVTARESVDERVRGLRMGADDYVIKPFVFAELLARIESVDRRRSATLDHGSLQIDLLGRTCSVGGQRVELTPREFSVLELLLRCRTVSRAEFLAQVWNAEHDPGTNVVEVHISRLRRKLKAVGGPPIRSHRGKGYSLHASPGEGSGP